MTVYVYASVKLHLLPFLVYDKVKYVLRLDTFRLKSLSAKEKNDSPVKNIPNSNRPITSYKLPNYPGIQQ